MEFYLYTIDDFVDFLDGTTSTYYKLPDILSARVDIADPLHIGYQLSSGK